MVDLNLARRSDLFAPRPAQGVDGDMATVPADLLEFTTTVRYTSGRTEGPITVRLPRALADLGSVERAVMVYACTRYATGAADEHGTVTFTLHDLARWVGWKRPNATQYDRLERAVEAIASVRFTQWADYLQAAESPKRGQRRRSSYERVHVTSIFGFVDEADIETRERAASRRQADRLPANAHRRISLWLNRRFRQALDDGPSVRLPHEALRRLGLQHHLALQLYFLIASKRAGNRPVELSSSVVEQVVRPTPAWRRNLRQRTDAACRLICGADPGWKVEVTDAAGGGWKVVATATGDGGGNNSAFGVRATVIRGLSNGHSGSVQQTFGVCATGGSPQPKSAKAQQTPIGHRASRAYRA